MEHFIVHARKAVLGGLSPDANRKIPPLKPRLDRSKDHGVPGDLLAKTVTPFGSVRTTSPIVVTTDPKPASRAKRST